MENFLSSIKQAFLNKSVKPAKHVVGLNDPAKKENIYPKLWFDKQLHSKQFLMGLSLVIIGLFYFISMTVYYLPRFLPETYVEGQRIAGLNLDEATQKIFQQAPAPTEHEVEIVFEEENQLIASSSTSLEARYQHQKSLQQLLGQQKQKPLTWLKRLLFGQSSPQQHYLPIQYSPEKIHEMVINLKQQVDTENQNPKATLGTSNASWSLEIDPGKNAYSLNFEETLSLTVNYLKENAHSKNLNEGHRLKTLAKVKTLSKKLTDEELKQAEEKSKKLIGKEVVFKKDYTKITLNDQDLISLLAFPSGINVLKAEEIISSWKTKLDQEPQEPELEYSAGTLKVVSFVPPQNGQRLDKEKTLTQWDEILQKTDTPEENQVLYLETTPPKKSLDATNKLGIKELVGFGESYYAHSIPNRIWNVALTAKKINHTIVAPGKEFSFNKTLGDVSPATGFRSAYVIKDGATVLGDGGGVCQVSTTLFRSLLDAGLEITRRIPHSYRVSYYELDNQPGFDATVYSGNIDLRFVNDTDHHILIYTETNSEDLYMKIEIYGTSDGRTTEIVQYSSWDSRAPLPTEYVLDPSLPTGKLKQIDWSARGIKAKFTHIVRDKDGNVMYEDEYYSNYRPWAAKFLKGV